MIVIADSEGPDQTARMSKADLGLRYPHMHEVTFSHGVAHKILWKSTCVIFFSEIKFGYALSKFSDPSGLVERNNKCKISGALYE